MKNNTYTQKRLSDVNKENIRLDSEFYQPLYEEYNKCIEEYNKDKKTVEDICNMYDNNFIPEDDKTYKYYCHVFMATPESYDGNYYTEEKEIIVSGVTNPFDASDISVTKPELNFDSEAMTYSWTTVPELTTELPKGFDWNYYIKYNYIDEYDRTYTEYFSYNPRYDSPGEEVSLYPTSGYTYSYLETYLELKKYESGKSFTIKIPVDVLPETLPLEIIGK